MKPAREQPSVQRDMLRLRETKGDMLCLYAPGSPTRRSYRAVLEVSPINLSLKAEDEQEAIIERFGALIRSLSFPVQILVRNQRLDLTPYIRHLLAQPGADGQHPPTWYALAPAWPNSCKRSPPSARSSNGTSMSSSQPHRALAVPGGAVGSRPCLASGGRSASQRQRNRRGRNWHYAQRRSPSNWPPAASPAIACITQSWHGSFTAA